MNKITKLVLTIIFIGAVAITANYAMADDDCGGKCRESYTVYMPLVYNSPVKAGYAWLHNQLFIDVLGMKNAHIWNIRPPSAGYIPHFSCNTISYNDFDDDAHSQFDDLREYIAAYGDAPFVLIFLNEPEYENQCSRTPENAAHMYAKVLEVAPNAIVTTPQVSHADYANGWEWMREWYYWIDVLGLPHPEIGAVHTYISHEPARMIIDSFMSEFDVDRIWVTEWAAASPDVLIEMLDTFENHPDVEKHFYFDPLGKMWPHVQLIEANGELTPLGDAWVDYFEHDIE